MSLESDLGKAAEEVAVWQLSQEGYSILARNFRIRRAEIDVICRKGRTILFVEVKGRRKYLPEETWQPLWRRKKWRIYAAARVFLQRHRELVRGADEFGFDILFVTQGRVVARFEEGRFF